jgi:hypothetical protein
VSGKCKGVLAPYLLLLTVYNRTTFGELQSLCRSLPGRLAAVNNEAADLEIVLYEIASLVKKRTALPDSRESPVPHLLKQANTKLLELQVVVARLRGSCRDTRYLPTSLCAEGVVPLSTQPIWSEELCARSLVLSRLNGPHEQSIVLVEPRYDEMSNGKSHDATWLQGNQSSGRY